MSRKIGITQESNLDEIKSDEKPKKKFQFQSLVGISLTGAILFGVFTVVDDFVDYRAEEAKERAQISKENDEKQAQKEKDEKREIADKYYNDKSLKQMAQQHVSQSVNTSQYSVIREFNKEVNSTEENKIFRSEFKIGTEALLMVVDVENAAAHFGVTEEVARLGIVQGSGNYRVYLERFRLTEGNGNKVLHIVDKNGRIISEVQ